MGDHYLVRVAGTVVRGEGVAGPVFGTPTANLCISASLPVRRGVYLSRVVIGGATYGGVTCYGADGGEKFETHILDFSGMLVDVAIIVEVVRWVSDLVPWESEEQMRAKIHSDVVVAMRAWKADNE